MEKEKEKKVSTRQMVFACVLLLAANLADEVISRVGFSLGFEEIGKTPTIVGMERVFLWKWLVCFIPILSLFITRRKPRVSRFLAKTILIAAVVVLLTQLYHLPQILAIQYTDQLVSLLKNGARLLAKWTSWGIKLFAKGLPGQS